MVVAGRETVEETIISLSPRRQAEGKGLRPGELRELALRPAKMCLALSLI
jgi:hypothetical protein